MVAMARFNSKQDKPSDPANLTLVHPRNAYSPEKCGWNQNDKNVWFLPDGRNLDVGQAENPEIRNALFHTIKHSWFKFTAVDVAMVKD